MGNRAGFSLVELAVVLFIMSLLLQASVEPLGQRLEHKRRINASDQLQQVHQHLKAHWVSYGYLPCPILPAVADLSSFCEAVSGGVPASSLGMIGSVNALGALLDPWGVPLRYSVSMSDVNEEIFPNTPDWLTEQEISKVNFTELEADLSVCREAQPGLCGSALEPATSIVAVVVSTGGSDTEREADNRDNNTRFISAPYSSASPHQFNDQLIWVGRSELIYLALQSGWLP